MTPENEEKKDYLMRYKWGQMRIAQIEEEIIQLRLSALPGAIKYDGMPKGSEPSGDMSGYAGKLDALIRSCKDARYKTLAEMEEVGEAINRMDDERYVILLRCRYIQLKEWEETARFMGYSTVHVKRMHGEALRAFEIPKDDTK